MRSTSLSNRAVTVRRPIGWSGPLDTTSKSLQSIRERAAAEESGVSNTESCLFQACELWAAAKSRTLSAHLGVDAAATLPRIGTIFATIGAPGVARDLDMAFVDLAESEGAVHRQSCIDALQNRLLNTDEPVDSLLARFAVELLGNAHAKLRRSRIAADS